MNTSARLARSQPLGTLASIGHLAALSLYDELALSPKPGLVTLTDQGSHEDMDANTFMRSIFALRSYFEQIAQAGFDGAPFVVLERLGVAAEVRMLAATGGINTHRGAIFMLGLVCASAGAVLREQGAVKRPEPLRDMLRQRWGDALAARSQRVSTLPGGMAARRHGLRSASEEAALGFPVLFDTAVPALRLARAQGLRSDQARLDTLFHIMAVLDDSNLAHRGGLEGLREAQQQARGFLAAGGAAAPGALDRANAIARLFVARRLSPGGAADTLATACFIQRLCGQA